MQQAVEDRIFVNDQGNQVKYKRLVITGYLEGNLETIELPISKEQAIIYNAMKNTERPQVTTKQGGEVEVGKTSNEKSWLD